ncbi:MAG: NAD(P)-binding protein [Pseudomonadota bacterium]
MTSNAYDAIIIGGGHNALAAGIHLAKTGMSVALFEQAPKLGGAVATEEVTLPGFRHDLYAMNLSLFAGSVFHAAYGAELAQHGLTFAPAKDCFSSAFPDGKWLGISNDLEANAARIEAFSRRDAERWRVMSADFQDDAQHFFALLGSPMQLSKLLPLGYRTARAKGMAWTYGARKSVEHRPESRRS